MCILRNTYSSIAHGSLNPIRTTFQFRRRRRDHNMTRLSKLHRISDKIDDDLSPAGDISVDPVDIRALVMIGQFDFLGRGGLSDELQRRLDTVTERKWCRLEINRSVLDLRKVEDAVDYLQCEDRGSAYRLDIFPLLFRKIRIEQENRALEQYQPPKFPPNHIIHPNPSTYRQQRIERCPYLMAHVRQKRTLLRRHLFGRLLRQLHLPVQPRLLNRDRRLRTQKIQQLQPLSRERMIDQFILQIQHTERL